MSKEPEEIDVITEITVVNNATDKETVYKHSKGKHLSFSFKDNNFLIINEYPENDTSKWVGLARFTNHSISAIKLIKIKNPNAGKPATK